MTEKHAEKNVVIIGGGIAGLTAAAYLSRAGMDVHLFERHTQPGGYISSFSRRGFTFPAGPTSFGSNGIVFPILEELGLREKCRFIPASRQLNWNRHDNCHDLLLHSPAQVCDELSAIFPHERRSLRRYFRWVETGGRGFRGLFESGLMFSGGKGALGQGLRLWLHNPLFPWAMAVARGRTNRSLHARYFRDPELIRMLDGLGYPVMTAATTLGMWVSYFQDYHRPLGGMQTIADVFAQSVREHGGHIHLGQGVRRILIDHGTAAGVRLTDETEIRARWVVSAADMRSTFLDMIGREHLLPSLITKLERGRPSESIFAVYLGLDDSAEMAASLGRFQADHIFFRCADGEYLQAVLLSKDNPSIVPPGRHALWLGRFASCEPWHDLEGAAYRQRKEDEAQDLIRRGEELVPGLSRHIEVMETASPLTFERYTGNWRGASAGWNWDPADNPQIKPATDVELKNFYCAGHWTYSPGGVPSAMITAWYIAQEILHHWHMNPASISP
ncbi:MAG: NAD(P)/FAD-dependent oxidoreductase [Firmicutes bacterium]|nr:NAD(P)/FAD-dependent oxidoreductase [Bacillota bacterium]